MRALSELVEALLQELEFLIRKALKGLATDHE